MSLTLELLRTEADREPFIWPYNARSGLISAVPHDCPMVKKAPASPTAENVNNNNNNNNNASPKVRNGLSHQHKRHSYYECCVNVEVSALLEHWLGWDDKNHPSNHCSNTNNGDPVSSENVSNTLPHPTKVWADRLVSHLVDGQNPTENPSIWVRKFCSDIGCDVLKKQDNNGKTLLHHLLSGAVKHNLASTAKILLEAGTPAGLPDSQGNTPLHLIRNLLNNQISVDEICQLVSVIVQFGAVNDNESVINDNDINDTCANTIEFVNKTDAKGRNLLSYAVEAGDRCVALTRLLINLGAKTLSRDIYSDQLGHQSTAFAWFLRAQMSKMGSDVAIDEETFYVISTAMMAEADGNGLTFKSVVDRCMVSMGSSPEAHGPLFRRIRGLAAPLWLQPPQLRLIATQSIRRSLGPKRLSSNKVMSRLKVPRKIQRFVTLEEKIPTN